MKKLLCLLLCLFVLLPSISALAWVDPESGIDYGDDFDPSDGVGQIRVVRNADAVYRLWAKGQYIVPDVSAVIAGGEEKESYDGSRLIEGGTLLAPLRAVLNAAEVPLVWDEASRTASVTARNGEILKLNVDTGEVEGIDAYQVEMKDYRTMIALEFFELIGGLTLRDDYTNSVLVIDSGKAKYGEVELFDFGEASYTETIEANEEQSGGTNTRIYPLNGAFAVPDKDKSPVVIFIHGSHLGDGDDPANARVDLGFSYIMRELAQKGIASFAFNMNIMYCTEYGQAYPDEWGARLLDDYMQRVMSAANGSGEGFPLSLKGKLDFSNVILVGHSRGGGNIFAMAPLLEKMGVKVTGLFAYGPTGDMTYDGYLDVPTAIVVGEKDGDVADLAGEMMFDDISAQRNRKSDAHLVYVYNANHNAFNEELLRQDSAGAGIMNPAGQRELYKNYVLDFIKAVHGGGSLLSLPSGADGNFYGERAMFSYTPGSAKRLVTAGTDTMKAVGGAEVTNAVYSAGAELNTLPGHMKIPVYFGAELPLIRISWTKAGAGATAELASGSSDFSGYGHLTLNLAQDSTDKLNNNKNQQMKLVLTDKNGKSFTFDLKNEAALAWQKGELVESKEWDDKVTISYSAHTPLAGITLSLSDVKGIDLTAVKSITLEFPENSGCIVLRGIALGK